MSQSLRRLWQVLSTLVGGDRRWLTASLAQPSHGSRRDAAVDRTPTAAMDSHAGGDERGSSTETQSPRDAILAALADNGGRLDQRAIPDAADLSQSTVSRQLIAMEERGTVTRYEIGRRKVVFVPGEEPEAFQSPLDGDESRHGTPS